MLNGHAAWRAIFGERLTGWLLSIGPRRIPRRVTSQPAQGIKPRYLWLEQLERGRGTPRARAAKRPGAIPRARTLRSAPQRRLWWKVYLQQAYRLPGSSGDTL